MYKRQDEASQVQEDDSVTVVSVAGKKLKNLLAGGKAGTDDPSHKSASSFKHFFKIYVVFHESSSFLLYSRC